MALVNSTEVKNLVDVKHGQDGGVENASRCLAVVHLRRVLERF